MSNLYREPSKDASYNLAQRFQRRRFFFNRPIKTKNHRHLFHSKNICPLLFLTKVNICPFPLPHFASIFFSYLWSFRWPNYIVTLPRYFSFRLPHVNIPTGPLSDELDKNIQRMSLRLLFSHWNGYSHFQVS